MNKDAKIDEKVNEKDGKMEPKEDKKPSLINEAKLEADDDDKEAVQKDDNLANDQQEAGSEKVPNGGPVKGQPPKDERLKNEYKADASDQTNPELQPIKKEIPSDTLEKDNNKLEAKQAVAGDDKVRVELVSLL